MITLVCPVCHGSLDARADTLACQPCRRDYPVIAGVPDLRLEADPYIGLEADREKAMRLAEAGRTRSFEALVRHYYEITPEDPPDLAARWTARAIAEVAIGESLIGALELRPAAGNGPVLDLGCGTAGLTVALAARGWATVGVDVALRWLVIAQHRLREAGSPAELVCASARHLPFESGTMQAVIGNDLIEHVDGPAEVLRESARVAAPGAVAVFTANNRLAPLPEPQLRLWGVGYLPRAWQRRYVTWRRPDTHPYRIVLRSAGELARMIEASGFVDVRIDPAPLVGPHLAGGGLQRLVTIYNAARRLPLIRSGLRWVGPRLAASARRPASAE